MIFEFNTDRPYSGDGQRIFVDYDPETGTAVFADVTRGVDGWANLPVGLSRWRVEGAIMALYDRGTYAHAAAPDTLGFLERCREYASGEVDESLEHFFCPGHSWTFTGSAYGGDDESYGGEGRCYCSLCGKDGDG